MVSRAGVEPATFSVWRNCSANWANETFGGPGRTWTYRTIGNGFTVRPATSYGILAHVMMPVGFEPTTSTLRGWRLNQFVDGTIFGDHEGTRTPDLQRDRLALYSPELRGRMAQQMGLEPIDPCGPLAFQASRLPNYHTAACGDAGRIRTDE